MIKNRYHFSLAIILVLGFSLTAAGQRDTTKLNQDVEVVKAYRPSVANAEKVNQLPEIDDTTRFTPEFNYQINSRPVTSGFGATPISAAKIQGQSKSTQGYGLLKAGIGNYSTPYGELFFNKPGSKNGTFGLHLKHLSSQGSVKLDAGEKVDAPYSHSTAEIFGSIIRPKVTLSADLSYNRDATRYYGYPTEIPDDILTHSSSPFFGDKQWYQKGRLNFSVKDNGGKDSKLNYHTGLFLQYFGALTDQKEKSGGVFANFRYDANLVQAFLETSFENYNTDSVNYYLNYGLPLTSQKRSWLAIKPSAQLSGDNWKVRVGVNFYSVFDKKGDNNTKMFPKLDLEFTPVEKIMTLYAGLDGHLQNNHLSAITAENPWVNPAVDVAPTDMQLIAFGGIKGLITNDLTYRIGIKYSKANDQYFYVMKYFDPMTYLLNNPANSYYDNAFMVTYDNTSTVDFSGELTYSKGDQLFVTLSGHYFNYSTEQLDVASGMPQFTVNVTSKYRLTNRITAFTDIDITGKREMMAGAYLPPWSSLAPPAPFYVKLDPYVNIKLGADYQLMNNLKLFGRVDNLLNQHYDYFLGYRAQGLRLMVGAALRF